MEKMVICCGCKDKFVRSMVKGVSNELYCIECFRIIYSEKCSTSRGTIYTYNKIIPYPELYCKEKRMELLEEYSSATSVSLRPLQCPKPECSKYISLFTLESHFKYEHQEVPIIFTQLDARSAMEFCPKDVRYNITQCIVLLNVINYDFSDIFRTASQYIRSNKDLASAKPMMILLASRLTECHFEDQDDSESEDLEANTISSVITEKDSNSSLASMEINPILRANELIVLWVASNLLTNLSYTVAVSNLSKNTRQKYYGPLLTLGDDPAKVCTIGACLILTNFHVNCMTENGNTPLTIDVVIHSPD